MAVVILIGIWQQRKVCAAPRRQRQPGRPDPWRPGKTRGYWLGASKCVFL